MAEFVGVFGKILPKGWMVRGECLAFLAHTVSQCEKELFISDSSRGFAVLWGGLPATTEKLRQWANTMIEAADMPSPTDYLSKKNQGLLHSGVALSYKKSRLLLTVGLYGVFPIYLVYRNGITWFGSHPHLVVRHSSGQIDPEGLAELLYFGHCLGRTTTIRDMLSLEPGDVWTCECGQAPRYHGRYISPIEMVEKPTEISGEPFREALERLAKAVDSSIIESSTLLALSGGLDSRLLLALSRGRQIYPFCIGESNSSDVLIAHKLAKLSDKVLLHFDCNLSLDQVDRWAKLVAWVTGGEKSLVEAQVALPYQHYQPYKGWVCLSGTGGESIRSYFYDLGFLTRLFDKSIVGGLSTSIVRRYLSRRMRGRIGSSLYKLLPPEIVKSIDVEAKLSEVLVEFKRRLPLSRLLDYFYLHVRVRRFIALGQQLWGLFFLRAHPYLDIEVQKNFAHLDMRWRQGSRFHRQAITEIAPDLAEIPWEKTGRPLNHKPSLLAFLPERWLPSFLRPSYHPIPFVNIGEWFRTRWRTWFADTSAAIIPYLSELVPRETLERLRKEHLDGTADHSRAWGTLLSLGLWKKQISSLKATNMNQAESSDVKTWWRE
ncbi:MAG: hypothetical protein DRG83_01070 [Deltaproteobacteria bacterium]|nr:MAG: hypothetical protein DRG83_01070 [Deltaproteobacteria bacterium]